MEINGARVRQLRLQKAFAQRELAERARTTRETIAKIESGERDKTYPATLRAIAEALEVDPTELMPCEQENGR